MPPFPIGSYQGKCPKIVWLRPTDAITGAEDIAYDLPLNFADGAAALAEGWASSGASDVVTMLFGVAHPVAGNTPVVQWQVTGWGSGRRDITRTVELVPGAPYIVEVIHERGAGAPYYEFLRVLCTSGGVNAEGADLGGVIRVYGTVGEDGLLTIRIGKDAGFPYVHGGEKYYAARVIVYGSAAVVEPIETALFFGYPLGGARSWTAPSPGSETQLYPSGEEDAWIDEEHAFLEGIVVHIPAEDMVTGYGPATGWNSIGGWQEFLAWARHSGNTFDFYRDRDNVGSKLTCYLEAPLEGPPEPEGLYRRLTLRVRSANNARFSGY